MEVNFTLSNTSCDPALRSYRFVGATLGIFVSVLGTFGNFMTILAFFSEPRLRSRFNYLVLNLAVSDLLYCGGLQPITSATYLRFSWPLGPTSCQIFGLLIFVANATSIFNLAILAASRYLIISRPRLFQRLSSRRGLPCLLALPWIGGLALFGPLWDYFVFVPPVCTCSLDRRRGRRLTTGITSTIFVVGLGSIGLFYYLIHRRLQAVSKALQAHRGPEGAGKKVHAGLHRAPASDSGLASSQATEEVSLGPAEDHALGEREKQVSAQQKQASVRWQKAQMHRKEDTGPAQRDRGETEAGQAHIQWEEASNGAGGEHAQPDQTHGPTEQILPQKQREKALGLSAEASNARDKKTAEKYGVVVASASPQARRVATGDGQCSGGDAEFRRVTWMCFSMFLVYILCYLPFCLLHAADKKKQAPALLHMVVANLTWFNSCINPVLYVSLHRQFRATYIRLLTSAFSPLLPTRKA
ncbi:G-protein coupled receptor 84 [Amblyraja radiata]|uniref:G-protein coupled receptor 84 n=1 Tax=Amblyraja radiata TaxID=386614 RepID=UPI0014041A8C|nr:G-protein coupled receptor 84 [Amblyraja radiata]